MSLVYSVQGTGGVGAVGGDRGRRGVYLGGKSDAKSRSKLDVWGVTHVLNVTPEKEAGVQSGVPNYFERSSSAGGSGGGEGRTARRTITYKRIGVYDAGTSDLLSHADEAVSFISSALHHGSVLVHCQRGVSRSATCVMFYLMRKVGMTFDAALSLCRSRRPEVEPIPAFVSQLRSYEDKCRRLGVLRDGDGDGGSGSGSKKRKGIAGPAIGPAMGPSRGGRGEVEVKGRARKNQKQHRVIGPSIPPGARGETSDAAVSPSAVKAIGLTGIRPAIGPEPPENVGGGARARSIGPSPPPRNGGGNRGPVDCEIGPSIGPPKRPPPREK